MIRKKIWRKFIKILKSLIFLDVGIMGNIYFIFPEFFQNFSRILNLEIQIFSQIYHFWNTRQQVLLSSELPFGEEVLYINIKKKPI